MAEPRALSGGVYAALVTPLDTASQIDQDAVARLTESLIDDGVDGLCPAGSAGEGPLLGGERRVRMCSLVCEQADGRVPVVPTVTYNHADSAVRELERFTGLGVSAALVTAPTFYGFGAKELTRYFLGLADRSPVPLLIYEVPAFVGVEIGPDVIADLAQHDNIVGLKDSSGDAANLAAVLDQTSADDFSVYCGSESLFSRAASHGAVGVIGGSVNIAADLVTRLWQAACADTHQAAELQGQLDEIARACRAVGRPFGWKAAASELGHCSPNYGFPVAPPAPDVLTRLRRTLAEHGLAPVGTTDGAAS